MAGMAAERKRAEERAAMGISRRSADGDLAASLEGLYARYNRREYVAPDPLQFLYAYKDLRDREIVGLIASSLAYGRVAQILRNASDVLGRLGDAPAEFAARASLRRLSSVLRGVRHRFTSGDDIAALLYAAGRAMRKHGSLERFLAAGLRAGDADILGAASAFVRRLEDYGARWHEGLLPSPESGSACKRLNLFFRWMVRRDEVDPGGWTSIGPEMLIVPVDTHMHRIAAELGLTKRAAADGRAAVEITGAFRRIRPDDPVRYDFVLTRIGIRRDVVWEDPRVLHKRGAGGMSGRGLLWKDPSPSNAGPALQAPPARFFNNNAAAAGGAQ